MSTTTTLTQPFRQHRAAASTTARPRTTTGRAQWETRKASAPAGHLWASDGLLSHLAGEWSTAASTTRAGATTRHWGTTETALQGYTHPGQILDAIDTGTTQDKDTQLGALIRLTQGGDPLAARTVLQAMLPKLTHLARYVDVSHDRPDDRGHIAVTAFLTTLHRYPIDRRPRGIAGNLALDTLHSITRSRRSTTAATEVPVSDIDTITTHAAAITTHGPNAATELDTILDWAADTGVISTADRDLLTTVHSPEPGHPGGHQAAAADHGLTPAAVRQRCSRATRLLRHAVLGQTVNNRW